MFHYNMSSAVDALYKTCAILSLSNHLSKHQPRNKIFQEELKDLNYVERKDFQHQYVY